MHAKFIVAVLGLTALALMGGIVTVARNKPAPPKMKPVEVKQPATASPENVKVRTAVANQEKVTAAAPKFHWSEVESADYKEYIARLRGVQCPEDTIRDIIVADINKLYAPREAPFKLVVEAPEDSSGDWHEDRPRRQANFERRKQLHAIQKEKNALLKELLGVELPLEPLRGRDNRNYEMFEAAFNALPGDKRESVRQIQESYWQNSDALKDKYDHKRTPEYLEEYRRINAERQAKLAQALTPEEMEDYDMRTSNVARNLQNSLEGFNPTEDEFKTLFRIRKAIEEPHGGLIGIVNPVDAQGNPINATQPMSSAERRQLTNEQVKEALGPERARQYELSQDNTYRNLAMLGQRYQLSADAVMQSYELQQSFAIQRQELLRNRALSTAERDAAMNELRESNFKQFTDVVGERAAKAFQRNRGGYYQ